MKLNSLLSYIIFLGLFIGCSQKPQSDVDTPEYHFNAGMRSIEQAEFSNAISSFERSISLDRKFAPGYAGLGIAHAHLGQVKEAKKFIGKAEDKGKKDPDVLALCARGWITLRQDEKKWYKRAESLLKKALKRNENHEASLYYYGLTHLYQYNFSDAESYFRRVVEMKSDFAGKADHQWNVAQKIVRAMPGTDIGKKVALYEKISRADLAVIFMEELKLSELFAKLPQTASSAFNTPDQAKTGTSIQIPQDAVGHWAESWVREMLRYGIMDSTPDGNFSPNETITRAEYAMAVQRLLVVATRDQSLELRYFGENPSRFSDVPSSHPAYNAMALCSERGIMQADVMTGAFNPAGFVGGADALLIIRTLQASLRMTF